MFGCAAKLAQHFASCHWADCKKRNQRVGNALFRKLLIASVNDLSISNSNEICDNTPQQGNVQELIPLSGLLHWESANVAT
jgi:hypothetical protein